MRTKSLPFQLERTTGGAFAVQGFAGGMLLGFILMVALLIAFPAPNDRIIFLYIYPIMAVTGFFGLIKSIPFGFMYHVFGIRMRAPVRVAASTVSLTLLTSYFAYRPFEDPRTLATIAGWCFLISLPTALLVGSRVRPWKILTYWRVTFRKRGIKERLRSSHTLAILGVLPLRVLSLGALGIGIAVTAATWSTGELDFTRRALWLVVPIICFAVSAYVTFSSPSQFVLLALAFVINVPMTYLAIEHINVPESVWNNSSIPMTLGIAYTSFICAWTAFVATRFVVEPKDFLPADARAYLKVNNKQDHDCLGSRFLEWREHAAH